MPARRGLTRVSVAAVVVLGSAALTSGAVRAEAADTDDLLPVGGRVEVAASPVPGRQRIVVDTKGSHSLVTVESDACPHFYGAVTARTASQPHLSLVWKRLCDRPPATPPATPSPTPPSRPEPSPPSVPTPFPPAVTAPRAALPMPARPRSSKAAGRPSPQPRHPVPQPVTHRTYQAPPRKATPDGTSLTTMALLLTAPAVLAGVALRPRSGSSRGGSRGR